MKSLRTKETEEAYEVYKTGLAPDNPCVLCGRVALKAYTHWKTIENEFPYDRIASRHNMLVPLRHVTEAELTQEELVELKEIKNLPEIQTYNWIIEATPSTKTIPTHFHLHLVEGIDEE